MYLKIIISLSNNIAEQENLIIEKSRPEDSNTLLPIFPWVCLQTEGRCFNRYSLSFRSRIWKVLKIGERSKTSLYFKICAMPPAIITAKTTYRFIMVCSLYARIKKKLAVDFLEIPLFIQIITVDRYGKDQWIIQSISLQIQDCSL